MERETDTFTPSPDGREWMGHGHTRPDEAGRLGSLFHLSGEACLLVPCVGRGGALRAFTSGIRKDGHARVVTYGTEASRTLYGDAAEACDHCRHADFLTGVDATRGFTLCFCSPPCMAAEGRFDRLETAYVNRVYQLMREGGYLVLIVQHRTAVTDGFVKTACSEFELVRAYRFDDDEYGRRHQLALILKRRARKGCRRDEAEAFAGTCAGAEGLPHIPRTGAETDTIDIPESPDRDTVNFRTLRPDYAGMSAGLTGSPLYARAAGAAQARGYGSLLVGRSPTPASRDDMYRLLMAGYGHGLAGSAGNGDIHLNRGVCRTVTEEEPITDGRGRTVGRREVTHAAFSMTVIEPCGRITELRIGGGREREDKN